MNKLLLFLLAITFDCSYAGMNPLQLPIAECNVAKVTKLLESKEDPNPVLKWFATSPSCRDEDGLATAKLLVNHGAKFGPEVLTSLSFRKLPKTLRFFAEKRLGDPTPALHTIAKGNDLETVRILLNAGADPLVGAALSSSLLDATSADRTAIVGEMLKHVKNKQSPKVIAAYQFAEKKGNQKMAKLFANAGVKLPPATPEKRPCERLPIVPNQSLVLTQLGIQQPECKFVQASGDLILIDCNSAADGPAFYINMKTKKVIATCGGACNERALRKMSA